MLMEGEHASRLTDVVLLKREDVFQNTHSRIPNQSQEARRSFWGKQPPLYGNRQAGCGSGSACGGILSFCRYFPGIGDGPI